MTLGTKETYPSCEPRRPPIPLSLRMPCQYNAPQKRGSQQYALRLDPATWAVEVQNSQACRVCLPFDLSSHQMIQIG